MRPVVRALRSRVLIGFDTGVTGGAIDSGDASAVKFMIIVLHYGIT